MDKAERIIVKMSITDYDTRIKFTLFMHITKT